MKPAWEKAVRAGDAELLRQLLADSGAQSGDLLNSKDHHGQTALMWAAMHGHEAMVELLLAHRAELDHTAKFGLSALMLAVINNHAGIVRMLVRAGADRSLRGTGAPGFYQKTALELAQAADRTEIVALLNREDG